MTVPKVRTQGSPDAEPTVAPSTQNPKPLDPSVDQVQSHPEAKKSTGCFASCMEYIWTRITSFFRWVFCRSQTSNLSETSTGQKANPPAPQTTSPQAQVEVPKEPEAPKLEPVASKPATKPEAPTPEPVSSTTAPDFSKPMGFEALSKLDGHFVLKAEDFFRIYASTGIRLVPPKYFFIHACSERIQKWILFALVAKKNPNPHSTPEDQNLVAQYDDITLIEKYLNDSKPSICALMQQFVKERTDSNGRYDWITITQGDLPRVEVILEEALRAAIAKEYGQPIIEQPAVKPPPLDSAEEHCVSHFIDEFQDRYACEKALKQFRQYTQQEVSRSDRIQERILGRLVEMGKFGALRTLISELTSNRFDAFYEKLWFSPDDHLADAPPERMKQIFEEGLPPTSPFKRKV